ncbi:MAG: hypothetical protein Q9171_004017 [Xanthocarpia ochracea]
MEPLSIAASLLSVLEATAVVSKAVIALYRSVCGAPNELAQLSARISQTRARLDVQLRVCQSIGNGSLKALLPDEALAVFEIDLVNSKNGLERIQETLSARSGHSNGKQCFNWVVQDKRKVIKVLGDLRDINDNLLSLLTTLSLSVHHPMSKCMFIDSLTGIRYVSLQAAELISNLNKNQLSQVEQWQCLERNTNTSLTPSLPLTCYPSTWSLTAKPKAHAGAQATSENKALQSSISIGHQKNELRSISWIIALVRCPGFLSPYAVCITVQLWLFRLSWPCLRQSLTVKRIIPCDSAFVKACAAGDVMEVRQLAWGGEGSPSCIDDSGKPVLHVNRDFAVRLLYTNESQHAISSGSYELVNFLLHNGASPEELTTRNHV